MPKDIPGRWVPLGVLNGGYQTLWMEAGGTVVAAYDSEQTTYPTADTLLNDLFSTYLRG